LKPGKKKIEFLEKKNKKKRFGKNKDFEKTND
jgi:hypothetical protein